MTYGWKGAMIIIRYEKDLSHRFDNKMISQSEIKKMEFKYVHMKDAKICVNHDGSWRRINKDLTTMNHTSEKSKRGSWRRGTGCDGEGQVDVWIRGIKLAMESHISLSVDLYWIIKKRWHGQEVKSWSNEVKVHSHKIKWISQENDLSQPSRRRKKMARCSIQANYLHESSTINGVVLELNFYWVG